MDIFDAMNKTMDEYKRITGLRSYLILDTTEVKSASERNYFCKCLKVSSQAFQKCEECTQEYYKLAREANEECIYSCHAGLIKWAVPVNHNDFHCVIMSEGILSKKQVEDSETWVSYLSKEYDLSKELIKNNFEVVTTMSEEQMQATIQLLKDLITYNLAIYEANKAE
ncbi:MAG: hypothetical protein HFF01_09055 [Erysipelotrichaceae bacterium]|nr:hypothetical protein [Erysipelotrichaceae bacterium]MCI9525155.1 hypothetical protein [Erysipelotrichaceae bacterium]